MPLSDETKERVGLIALGRRIRELSRDELVELFPGRRRGTIDIKRLMRNIIYEVHTGIRLGEVEPIRSNMRRFWYLHVKPVLGRIPDDDNQVTEAYVTMNNAFSDLVIRERVFDYTDFDFTDPRWENRRIGVRRPEVILFAEKVGWVRFVRRMHVALDITVLANRGQAQGVTSAFTAAHVKEALRTQNRHAEAHIIALVDYDPSGYIAAEAFARHLRSFELPVRRIDFAITPDLVDEPTRARFAYTIPSGTAQKTRLVKWMQRTGGIDGQPKGLRAEAASWPALETRIRSFIDAA